MPPLLALRDRQRPLHQVANVRQNLTRRARLLRRSKMPKCIGRTTYRFTASICESGESVPK